MSNQKIEQVKELLRIKNAEVKKLDAARSRQEIKFKHLMSLSTKKLNVLQGQLEEKEEQIRYQLTVRRPSSGESHKTEEEKRPDTAVTSSSKTSPSTPPAQAEPNEEIKQILTDLKNRNRSLTRKIKEERKENERIAKEKTLLAREVRRLRKDPAPMDQIKAKVDSMEEENEDAKKRYESLIREKDNLILTYEKLMQENSEANSEEEFPVEIIWQIREELNRARQEKEEIEKELELQKKKFDIQLSYELQRINESLGKKRKIIQNSRRKLTEFVEEAQEDQTNGAWITTYADMTTLLLTFFVLYYSLASISMNRFKEAILGQEQASIGLLELLDAVESKETIDKITGLKSDNILSDIKNVANKDVKKPIMDVSTDSAKIVVRVPGQTLFPPGSAELNLEASRPVLDELIRIVGKYPNYKVSIQGHTDDTPIVSDRYPSNWELSAARATAVLRYFIDKNIEPQRLTATGFADIFPIATNQTELGQATNRRVEFVLEKEK